MAMIGVGSISYGIIIIMSITIITIMLNVPQQQQYGQAAAHAFPCVGDTTREYCRGYHDGAIQAHRDYNSGDDISLDQHRCTINPEYCKGYDRGYNDETDFLG
jgi:hypothetical protein